jgi:hypothetical protein
VEAVAQAGRGAGGGGRGSAAAAPMTSTPPLELGAYAGTFVDSLFGEVTVTVKDGKLNAVRAGLHGPVEPVNRDNFNWSTGLTVLPTLPLQFLIGPDGRASALSISFAGESWLLARKPTRASAGGNE